MAKSNYLPRTDKDRVVWLNNFASKFAQVSTGLGFVAADVTSVNNDATMFSYLINQVELYTTAKEQRVDYKNLIKDGPLGTPGGALPVAPAAGTVPTVVLPGIFARIGQLVGRIKNSATYTEAIGKDLGIIGAQQTFDPTQMKPVLKLAMLGGQVEVQWTKGDADALRIEADKGSGWQLLAIDTVPHYTDTTPITAPAVWRYRAMYLVADELVGQWSDVASITVSS
jgi:hypothetical protein